MENNQVMPILSFIISTGAIKKFIGGILMGCLCSLLVVGNDAHALSESNRGNRLSTDQFVLSSSYQKLRRVLTKNASLGQLPSITKDGYAFLGWYKEKSYTNKVSSTTTIGSDITLYAKLQKCGPYERVDANVASNSGESKCVECAVVLDGNGGTPKCNQAGIYKDMPLSFTGGACGTEANLSSIYEQSHSCTIEAQREGYRFSGWYTAPSGGTSVSKSHMVYGNTYYAHWKAPITCPAGEYLNGNSCSICSAGTYSSAGASSCRSCPAGTYSSAGASSCRSCPAGTYSSAGASSCTNCPCGTYSSSAGSSSCSSCGAGKYSSAGATSCQTAEIGYYANSSCNQTHCTNGDPYDSFYTSNASSNSCSWKCDPGYHLNSSRDRCIENSTNRPR